MTERLGRRRFLVLAGGAVVGACGVAARPVPPTPPSCEKASSTGLRYCLTDPRLIRVPGAASMAIGQALLVNVDDATAAVLTRDSAGLFALSAICTHQCCLLEICIGGLCADTTTNPGACGATPDVATAVGPSEPLMFCACHGSSFASDGRVLAGPALRTLPALSVSVDGADVVIDTGLEVAHDLRVAAKGA